MRAALRREGTGNSFLLTPNFIPHPIIDIDFSLYLPSMQTIDTAAYEVLQIIYRVVKEESDPLSYQVRPRELILRSMQDWDIIYSSLEILEKEGLIVTRQLDTLRILLTQQGLDICRA
jgi:hypothetical protein